MRKSREIVAAVLFLSSDIYIYIFLANLLSLIFLIFL